MNGNRQLEERLRRLAVSVDPSGVWAGITARAAADQETARRTRSTGLRVAVLASLAVFLVAAAAIGGAVFRGNLERTGVYPSGGPTEGPELLWKFAGAGGGSSPAVSGGVVYVGGLYALDAQTGEEKWKFADAGGSPAVSDGVAYVGGESYLYAVDIQSGQEKWKFQAGGPVLSSPAISGGVIYFGNVGASRDASEDGYLHAVDIETAEEIWKFRTGGGVDSSPAISAGVVCFTGADGYLYALDAQSGQGRWKLQIGQGTGSPAIADGVVYSGTVDSSAWAYDSGGRGYLYAVDIQTGQEKWKFRPGHGAGYTSCPAVSGGVVYIGGDDGFLYALDAQSGQEKWESFVGFSSWGSGVWSSPSISGEVVYVGGSAAGTDSRPYPYYYLIALDIITGQELWKFKTDSAVISSPAVYDGVVYFTSVDGYLYAVK